MTHEAPDEAVEYARRTLSKLEPVPTDWEPKVLPLIGVEAVIFDVYGTLLQSAAGDTGVAGAASAPEAMALARSHLGMTDEGGTDQEWRDALEQGVRRRREEFRASGIEHPEVEIRVIWSEMINERTGREIEIELVEEAILRHECAVNPTDAMPGAAAIVDRIRARGLPLGIVSNAQFYTRPVFAAAFGEDWKGFGFDERLCLFSFEEGEGKPSPNLFDRIARRLEEYGLDARDSLYLGNDVRKDIRPAREAGFQTGLFAGDARSLRPGEGGEEEARALADVVLTDWAQLARVVPLL